MVSLSEVKQEILELEEKVKDLQLSYQELRMIEATAMKIMRILIRMTGSEDADAAIRKLQQLIMTVQLAQATIHAFQIASGPIGWTFAIVGAVGTALTVGDVVLEVTNG